MEDVIIATPCRPINPLNSETNTLKRTRNVSTKCCDNGIMSSYCQVMEVKLATGLQLQVT